MSEWTLVATSGWMFTISRGPRHSAVTAAPRWLPPCRPPPHEADPPRHADRLCALTKVSHFQLGSAQRRTPVSPELPGATATRFRSRRIMARAARRVYGEVSRGPEDL